jgi:L-seryl-tRNA(Ser) seleniumtransferase
MGIYERLGVPVLINGQGTVTRIGGSIMAPEVLEAMAEASRNFVDIVELNDAIGREIACIMRTEAALVTAGSADAILLATAGILTGTDPGKIRRLPDTTGMKNQVITHKCQRHVYDHSVRAAGAQLVEIGMNDRTFPWELEQAINDQTAAVFYTIAPRLRSGALPFPEVVEIAHRRGIPVYVDAASMLPPAESLWRWTEAGADLVIFSGGKGLMGPQSSGILAGKKDLIAAARLNHAPFHSIGRTAKVCREEMAGLLVALERYVQRDHQADYAHWTAQAGYITNAVNTLGLPGVQGSVVFDEDIGTCPNAVITIDAAKFGRSAYEVRQKVEGGVPRIILGFNPMPETCREIVVNPHMLQAGETEVVAQRIVGALKG